ncbi:amino acid/polyamine transporter I [Chytriomyces sp. MP71]|nr:amino acid/polyamine transporter I [Chytriomyces sp. MP71]
MSGKDLAVSTEAFTSQEALIEETTSPRYATRSTGDRVREAFSRLFVKKPVDEVTEDPLAQSRGYKRRLGAFELILLGVGGIIGAGIFVITGRAAAQMAGPAVILSFVFAGFVAGLASLCYAEMASLVPVSGSAYSYAYHTMGELVAWIIGWDLLLEYLVGAATVAVGWSGYLTSFVATATNGSYQFDARVVNSPVVWLEAEGNVSAGFFVNYVTCPDGSQCPAIMNLPAIVVVAVLTILLASGIKMSSTINAVAVGVKITIILLFIFIGFGHINSANYNPFIPPNEGSWGKFGWSGVFSASTSVFFAYIGFDCVSTTAQEAKNPQRDLPLGIIGSLVICTVLYIAVSAVLTGVQNYALINAAAPVSNALPYRWLSILIDLGALFGLFSVILVMLLGQPRILHAMATDGLLPARFARIHERTGTPLFATVATGVACAAFAGVLPIDILGNMTSVGTLLAFFIVCMSIPILRVTRPDAERKFQIPGGHIVGGFVIPILGAFCSLGLIAVGSAASIARLFIWMFLGLLMYFTYGIRHSKLKK